MPDWDASEPVDFGESPGASEPWSTPVPTGEADSSDTGDTSDTEDWGSAAPVSHPEAIRIRGPFRR